jgi:predicted secreted protein
MAKFNGTLLSITIGGTAIELNTSVSLTTNTAEVECTNKDSGGFKEFLPGTKDWSMGGTSYVDYLATEGLDEALAAWLAGTSVAVVFTTGVVGDSNASGSAYFTNIEQTGELDGAAEWTFTLGGSGVLTLGTEA